MAYDEVTIPAIQKEWETSFVERYRLFTNVKDRNHTLEVMLRESHPDKATQIHPVTLTIFVKSDRDTEQLLLDMSDNNKKSQEKQGL